MAATHTAATSDRKSSMIRVAMVSDFFYPNLGGVETHIWSLSQCLLEMGHKVVVITHSYGGRKGIRYMTNGLKVYYLPMLVFAQQDTSPTLYGFYPLFRKIMIREGLTHVHCHQATSMLGHHCMLHARTMGYRVCYTDHSLFSFSDAAGIHINKLMKFSLSCVEHAICVSHTCRENLVLRSSFSPLRSSAIPNAVDPTKVCIPYNVCGKHFTF
jgi:phosphatidylinositol glycan class A protein